MAINAAIEYVKKKEGIELEGKDRFRYNSIIINDEEILGIIHFKYQFNFTCFAIVIFP
jgi:hypothetical protein